MTGNTQNQSYLFNSPDQIRIIGYCSLSKTEILRTFSELNALDFTKLSGEYILVLENSIDCYIISSAYGVCQYYYTLQNNKFYHDDTVTGVLKKSQISWKWNWESLADLMLLEHLLEEETLHPEIHRVPARSVLHFRDGKLKISSVTWEELNPWHIASPKRALQLFNQTVQQWMDNQLIVSMSGGFDSRVILSSVLNQGGKPLLLTMGSHDSTDVVISRDIAQKIGLELEVVGLHFEDYFKYAKKIVSLTNGTKTARHWHTYLYTYLSQLDRNYKFLVGANGEFVRYDINHDQGILSLKENLTPISSLTQQWSRRLSRGLFKAAETQGFIPELAQQFSERQKQARVERIIKLSNYRYLSGRPRFFLEQYVRNFVGNGLKLCLENYQERCPFLDKNWISEVWNLDHRWKFSSNWHRYAISKNYPQLLDFPEEGKAPTMASKAPFLYWRSRKSIPVVPYASYAEWFQQPIATEFILDNTELLTELMDRKLIAEIVESHQKQKDRTAAMAFLVTMIFWKMIIQEV